MRISEEGLDFIAEHEGLKLAAYPDPGTGNEPWTIGVGHTIGVQLGDTCTREQALEWLSEDCETAEKCVNNSVRVDLTQSQFDALVSLVFNIGTGNFRRSTLLARLNEGADDDVVAKQFSVWNRAGGRVMDGLSNRRADEAALFLA